MKSVEDLYLIACYRISDGLSKQDVMRKMVDIVVDTFSAAFKLSKYSTVTPCLILVMHVPIRI